MLALACRISRFYARNRSVFLVVDPEDLTTCIQFGRLRRVTCPCPSPWRLFRSSGETRFTAVLAFLWCLRFPLKNSRQIGEVSCDGFLAFKDFQSSTGTSNVVRNLST